MGSADRPGRFRRILDIVGAAVAALLAFTAVPAVLVGVVGNPLTGGLGHAWRPLARDVLCLLVLAAWVAWAACCAQLLRAVVAHVRSGEVGVRQGSSVLDRVAARIAFGVLALTSLGAPLSLAAGAASPPAGHAPGTSLTAAVPVGTLGAAVAVSGPTYAVQRGDTLWRIVDEVLGDGADWTSLAALNLGHDVGGGARFVDPDRLREGWRLRLPPDAGRPSGDRDSDTYTRPTAKGPHSEPDGHLPELIALGLGSLACAALARRAGSRRRMGMQFTGEAVLPTVSSESALDTATLLQRFQGVPALHSFEAANCLLGHSLQDRTSVPPVRAICVSDSGVTFCFAAPHPNDPPAGFAHVKDGAGWHVGHAALDGHDLSFPYLPVVLPIGDNAEGTWLVPLEPGDVLPVLGESAPALWRAARAAVGSWAWSEMILVAEDPEDAALRAEAAADPFLARRVLFCGDPASLPPASLRAVPW